MAISIKDDAADRLARELAGLTGETLTKAITEALRERLERERRARDQTVVLERARAIVRGLDGGGGLSSGDHAALLYDERGLPR